MICTKGEMPGVQSMIRVNGFEKGYKCEKCKKNYPDIFKLCDGTDAQCVNFDDN